jgi:hypothetical protein
MEALMVTYALVLLLIRGDSRALTTVPGFTSSQACDAAAEDYKGLLLANVNEMLIGKHLLLWQCVPVK